MLEPILACVPRSPLALIRAVASLDLEHNFLPEDLDGDGHEETKCNWAAHAFAQAMGVELPRVRANDQQRWLSSEAGRAAGWEEVAADNHEVQTAVVALHIAHGRPVFATYFNPRPRFHPTTGARLVDENGHHMNRPGHIAFGSPTPTGETGIRIAQAGARPNFSCGRLRDGFGNLPIRFFVHE